MSIIAIKDLKEDTTLPPTTMSELRGGMRRKLVGVSNGNGIHDDHAGNGTSFPGADQALWIAAVPPPPPPPTGATFGVDQGKW